LTTDTYIIRSPQSHAEWEIVKKLLIDYRAEFNNDSCFTSFDEELADIENLYAGNGYVKRIAVSIPGGEIAGCIASQEFASGITEMKRLYVAPGHRGRHLGRRLAETIIALATEMGYSSIYLDTMVEMKTAQQLYDRLGFKVRGAYDDQDLTHMICYEKLLKNG
jgi:ribosomal protein S18 acetylase RimI-like enzyme